MCITEPDAIVSAHAWVVACCLIFGPLLCALVITLWKLDETQDYRGDKHW